MWLILNIRDVMETSTWQQHWDNGEPQKIAKVCYHPSIILPYSLQKSPKSGRSSLSPLRETSYPCPEQWKAQRQNHGVSLCSQHCTDSMEAFCYLLPSFPSPLSAKVDGLTQHPWSFLQSGEPARHLFIQLKIHPQHQKRRNTNQRQPIMPLSMRWSINLQNLRTWLVMK